MNDYFKTAVREYNDARRMFDYASTVVEVDVAIMLMDAADIKIKALKYIPNEGVTLKPISEVY